MLKTTMSTAFVPGTNLKGEVAGANWTFLLPSLKLERIVCLGVPPVTTLTTLSQIGQKVLVLCADSRQRQTVHEAIKHGELPNITLVTVDDQVTLPFADDEADLVLIGSRNELLRLRLDNDLPMEIRRILKPEGIVYFEVGGAVKWWVDQRIEQSLGTAPGSMQLLWLTPLKGEMHTAVPLGDRATIRYFLRHRLYSSSIALQRFKRTFGRFHKGKKRSQSEKQTVLSADTLAEKPGRVDPIKRLRRRIHLMARKLGLGLQGIMTEGERLLLRGSQLAWRRGALVSQLTLSQGPPQYLGAIAQASGVNIGRHRWGLVAKGDYSSRKVLFFLFDPEQPPEAPAQYIAKMVRNAAFNARLENECHALQLLREKGVGDRGTLPQVVFSGHHNGLAIVGETVVEGVPFRRLSSATADCPYGRSAINWLIELGAATVNLIVATPAEAATSLQELFTRFVEIYRLSPEHKAFLSDQIEQIGHHSGAFPLVFQHGDPGTWNVLVNRKGHTVFLDWEAAEPQGMPLWDLFYFMRSYAVTAARKNGTADRLQGCAEWLLEDSSLSPLLIEATERYCQRTGLSRNLVGPLFHTCWMHRALKEATRLSPSRLEKGHYVNLLRLGIDRHDTTALLSPFSTPG